MFGDMRNALTELPPERNALDPERGLTTLFSGMMPSELTPFLRIFSRALRVARSEFKKTSVELATIACVRRVSTYV